MPLIWRKKKNIKVFKGGIESLTGKKADIIVLSHVVEHFTDVRREFEKIKRILNYGSYVYIEVPGVCDLKNKKEYNYDYQIYSIMAHIYNFNLTSLRSVIEPLGFKYISGNEFVRSLFQYDSASKPSIDFSHNYEYIIEHLKQAEKKRTGKLSITARIKRKLNRIYKNIMNKLQ